MFFDYKKWVLVSGIIVSGALAFVLTPLWKWKSGANPKTLRVGLLGSPSSLDPRKANDLNVHLVLQAVHSGLVKYSSTGQIEADLAKSWRVNGVSREMIFVLDRDRLDGVGQNISCDEVAKSLEEAFQASAQDGGHFDGSCENQDELTLRQVSDPEPLLSSLARTTFAIVPERYSGGLGQYELIASTPKFIQLRLRESAKQGGEKDVSQRPVFIEFQVFDSSMSAIQAFRTGEVHVVFVGASDSIESIERESVRTTPAVGARWFISFGGKFQRGSLFRRCLNRYLDRDRVVSTINRGELRVAEPAFGVFSYQVPDMIYRPNLLEEGPTIRSCRFELSRHRSNHEILVLRESAPIAAVKDLENQMSALGVKVKITPLARPEFIARFIASDFEMAFLGFGASDSVAESINSFFSQKARLPFLPVQFRKSDAQIRKIIQDMQNPIDVRDLDASLFKQALILPLFFERSVHLVSKCLEFPSASANNPIVDLKSVRFKHDCH